MNYRELGKTGLKVSEVGFGAEWMERHGLEDVIEVVKECEKQGINLMDVWMSEPNVRTNLGIASKTAGKNGISRGISVPPGRAVSMCGPGTWGR